MPESERKASAVPAPYSRSHYTFSLVSMPGADNVYMAKLAEQAERYEEMVRAHRRRRTAPLSPPPHGPHPPPQLTPPTVCVRRLST